MNFDAIDRLARLVKDLDLAEIEIKRLGEQIRIVGRQAAIPDPVQKDHQSPVEHASAPQAPWPDEESSTPGLEQVPDQNAAKTRNWVAIKAPMVGTFYRAPAPDAPPYAEIGQILEVGQTVCIIEAMKLMNEIHSDVRGKIVSILVENAQPVEFGQTLIEVDPSATI
jgi:acetyl-CoA carboxylase biotin carboxyl carrier protein